MHFSPAGLQVVATGTTTNGTTEGTYTATVYPGLKQNFVFDASTCWWADGLAEPPGYVRPALYTEPRGVDRRVEVLTRNVLERMRG